MRFKTVMTSEKISIYWTSCKNCVSSKWSEWLQMALLSQWERALSIACSSRDVWPSRWARRNTQGALTSNYSTRMETEANLKVREKNSRVFSQRCGTTNYEETGTLFDPTFTWVLPIYLLHILLRFHWISMRISKVETNFWRENWNLWCILSRLRIWGIFSKNYIRI